MPKVSKNTSWQKEFREYSNEAEIFPITKHIKRLPMKNSILLIIVLSVSVTFTQAQTGIYQATYSYQQLSPERLVLDIVNNLPNTYQIPNQSEYLTSISSPLVLNPFMLESIDDKFKEYGYEITGKQVSDIGYVLFLKRDKTNYSITMKRGYIPNQFGSEQSQILLVKHIHKYVMQ